MSNDGKAHFDRRITSSHTIVTEPPITVDLLAEAFADGLKAILSLSSVDVESISMSIKSTGVEGSLAVCVEVNEGTQAKIAMAKLTEVKPS